MFFHEGATTSRTSSALRHTPSCLSKSANVLLPDEQRKAQKREREREREKRERESASERERERERERESAKRQLAYSFVNRRSTNQHASHDQDSCATRRVVQFLKREKSGSRTRR